MAEYYFSVAVDNERTLCIAPLTDKAAKSAQEEPSDKSGYFLFERAGAGDFERVDILAHLASEEAAIRMRELLGMS